MIFKIAGMYYDTVTGHVSSNKTKLCTDEYRPLVNPETHHLEVNPTSVGTMGVIPTLNCANRCIYCLEDATEGHKDLDFEVFKTAFDDLASRYICGLSANGKGHAFTLAITGGGEPTYNWDLFRDIVNYARESARELGIRLKINLTTNATRLDEQKLQFVADNVDILLVSYDGTSKVHDRNRPGVGGTKNSVEVERNLAWLSERRKVSIRTVLMPSDFQSLRDMIDNIAGICNLSNISWSVNPAVSIGRGRNIVQIPGKSFIEAFDDVVEYARDRYGFDGISTPVVSDTPVEVFCGAVLEDNRTFWLYPDGMLYTCTDHPVVPIGAVIDGRLCFEDDYTDVLKEAYLETSGSDTCRNCIAYHVCRGGCPAKKIRGEIIGTSVTCISTKHRWKKVLEKLCAGATVEGLALEDTGKSSFLIIKKRDDIPEEPPYELPRLAEPICTEVAGRMISASRGITTRSGTILSDGETSYYLPGKTDLLDA